MSPSLLDQARAWAAADPDPRTRAELESLIEAAELTELADRFAGPLEFGTAGLRGPMGAGPNRMNRVVVQRAAAGLAAYLTAAGSPAGAPVVIGYDARHLSDQFARDTAELLSGAGFSPRLMPHPVPTPVLAYAIRALDCVAGVMVTASHNPGRDNGYKVYLGDGSQIVPPVDTEIAARIAAVGELRDLPRGGLGEPVGDEVLAAYEARVAGLLEPGPRELRIVYTALHGVGTAVVRRVLAAAGFDPADEVPAQAEPDPDFPTTPFPNPEEPGTLDLALALAAEVGADLVLANDPDADRCAVAVPGPHGWQMLRGDEVGAVLAGHLLDRGRHGVYATSIVSSRLLSRMAAAAGEPHQETLTGFKWIGRIPGLAFGYEEALGYCVDPEAVGDKDGISALVTIAAIAAAAKAEGRGLLDLLEDISRRYGVHATDQLSVRFDDRSAIEAAITRLRAGPPAMLGGLRVERVEDLREGSAALPPTDGLRYVLAEDARVIVRGSGTEPKLKCYLEVVVPVEPGASADAARISAAGRLDAIRADLRQAAGL